VEKALDLLRDAMGDDKLGDLVARLRNQVIILKRKGK